MPSYSIKRIVWLFVYMDNEHCFLNLLSSLKAIRQKKNLKVAMWWTGVVWHKQPITLPEDNFRIQLKKF